MLAPKSYLQSLPVQCHPKYTLYSVIQVVNEILNSAGSRTDPAGTLHGVLFSSDKERDFWVSFRTLDDLIHRIRWHLQETKQNKQQQRNPPFFISTHFWSSVIQHFLFHILKSSQHNFVYFMYLVFFLKENNPTAFSKQSHQVLKSSPELVKQRSRIVKFIFLQYLSDL